MSQKLGSFFLKESMVDGSINVSSWKFNLNEVSIIYDTLIRALDIFLYIIFYYTCNMCICAMSFLSAISISVLQTEIREREIMS